MAYRKNRKRIDPRYFLHETVMREMNADIAKQLDQIVLSATQALRGILESGLLSVSRDPEAQAGAALRPGDEAPRNVAGGKLEAMIAQYVEKLDETAALQLGRGGSSSRGGDAAAAICGEVLRDLPPCPEGEEGCGLMRNAVGYLACLEQGDGGRWLQENGLAAVNQKVYGALNDKLRNSFQKGALQEGWGWRAEDEEESGSEFLKSKGHDPETAEPFKGTKTKRGAAKRQRRQEDPAGKEIEDLDEECPGTEEGGAELDISGPGVELHVDDISQLPPDEAFAAGIAAARAAIDELMDGDEPPAEEELQQSGDRPGVAEGVAYWAKWADDLLGRRR